MLKVKVPSTQQHRFVHNILNNNERKPIPTAEDTLKVCSNHTVFNNGVSLYFVKVLQMHTLYFSQASILFSLYIEATCFIDADKPNQANNGYSLSSRNLST
jgi:hypothetical protein